MNAIIVSWGIFAGTALLVGQAVPDDAKLTALNGTWKVTSTIRNGEPIKDREISGSQFTFSGDELLLEPGNDRERERFKVKPEANSTPLAFQATRTEPANRPQRGWFIYELKDDHLRIAFFDALRKRPASFDPSPKLVVLELEKVAKQDAPENVRD